MSEKTGPEKVESHFLFELLETIFLQSLDMIGAGNLDGYFSKINPSFERILGYTEKEFLAAPFLDFVCKKDYEKTKQALIAAAGGQKEVFVENRYRCKDGSTKWIDWKVFSDTSNNLFVAVGRDITEQKLAKDSLQQAHDKLEQRVIERTAELSQKTAKIEEVNAALNVLLEKRKQDKETLEKEVLFNIEKLIVPFLEKLTERCDDDSQKLLMKIIQTNLNEITSSFAKKHKDLLEKLTPMQVQVADLIKQGYTTKEIASILHLSPSTIACHRQEIRKRLSLNKEKINLRTLLIN